MAKKTNNQIALEVLLGKWGSGKTREKKLKEAGYDYNVVQNIVNDLMTKKDTDTVAREVIAGKWGSGETREKCLKIAGYNYNTIQNRVNEILNPPKEKTIDDLAFEVIIGDWGSGDDRKKRLEAAGYNYNAVQNRVNDLLAQGFRTRRQAMQPWYDKCEEQRDWSYNARYDWGKWDKTIKGSKDYGTCITYPSVVAMRTGMIKEGRYITFSGSDHDSKATLDDFWNYTMKSLATINSKFWRSVKYPNKTTAELVKEGKIKEGDIIGFMGHTSMYAGKDKNGNLLFNNAGHAAGIYGDKPGSNRAVLNQKSSYMTNRKVYGVFSVNTFYVMTKCEGGTITKCDQYMAGQNVTITIKPSKGTVKSLKVDGKVVTAGTSYTFKAIDANHTIEAVCDGDSPEKKGYEGKFPEYHLVKTNAQVIADTIKWAKWIAGDNRFHYGVGDHAHHNGCYFCGTQRMKMNHGIKMPEFTYCCNPFVGAAWAHGGGDATAYKMCHNCNSWDFNKGQGYDSSKLFDKLGHPAKSKLKPGDVLCRDTHVALYIGNGKIVEASGGDDNVPYSNRWNNSIRVRELTDENYKNFPRVYRYNGHVDCDRLICYGDVADRVGDMQAFLNWYGNYGLVVDCEFGDKTRAALLDFQTKEGLVADAICGKDTIARMKAIRK